VLAPSRRYIIAPWLVVGLAPQAFAQELCLVPEPPFEMPPASPAQTPPEEGTLEILTKSIGSVSLNEATLSDVEIRYGEGKITAEGLALQPNGSADLTGRVEVRGPEVLVFGQDAHYDPDAEKVSLAAAGFDLPTRPARGSAQQIELTSDSRVSLASMLFTTCPPDNVSWEISAKTAELDVNAGVGRARGVKLDFKGVPVLYVPYFSFPINAERKSGFLTPDISKRDRTGFDLSVPYYFNLAPNYDLTRAAVHELAWHAGSQRLPLPAAQQPRRVRSRVPGERQGDEHGAALRDSRARVAVRPTG
jgi:LPS-assembly protein